MNWPYHRVFSVELGKPHHLRPGRVERSVDDVPVPYPHALAIETLRNLADEDEYVIVLLDQDGCPLTHSHPYDLDDAFADCEYEFGVRRDEWAAK